MSAFNPLRLQLARERKGLFRKDLAQECGVTPQTVSNWETGKTAPSSDNVARLVERLGFPESFFFRPGADPLAHGAATFRARTKIPARQKHAALAAGAMARELATWIEERFELPPVDLPDLSGQRPELAAEVIRAEWMLGEKPIPNVIHLLESRGVLVFSLAQDCIEIDAFSFWAGSRPIVLLNTMKSAERSRMDGAHELLHLVAHREETGKKEEEQANGFAGAFLMPKQDVYRHIPRISSLHQLIAAKRRWGVALAALVYRLHDLGIASDWQYRTLFVELSKRGYRTNEPQPMAREASSVLPQVFGVLRDRGTAPRQVAQELGWHRQHLNELIFGLGAALLTLEGGGRSRHGGRPDLKLV